MNDYENDPRFKEFLRNSKKNANEKTDEKPIREYHPGLSPEAIDSIKYYLKCASIGVIFTIIQAITFEFRNLGLLFFIVTTGISFALIGGFVEILKRKKRIR